MFLSPMDLLRSFSPFPVTRFVRHHCSFSAPHCNSSQSFAVRSSLPFPPQTSKYHRELEAAVDVVEKACRLCVDVKKSLFSSDGRILEKNDQTPVTVADFGVQALLSLELSKLFPSIPLVAEDSSFLSSNVLADSIASAVSARLWLEDKPLTCDDVLDAIDRGAKDAYSFGLKPATYWILDPIDGTRGFLKGSEALYVTWESLPLSTWFSSTTNVDSVQDKQVLLLPACCGSLCKYLMVASGRASIFILRARAQSTIKAWDHAVGMICVHEAGGMVTDWNGSQLDLAADQVHQSIIFPSGGVLVTNGSLHSQILEMISAISSIV